MIRQAKIKDIYRIIELYCLYMEDSFLVRFGKGFLKQLFEGIIVSKHGLCFVYEDDSKVRGFIAGTSHLSKFFRDIFFRKGHILLVKLLPEIIKYPLVIGYITESFSYSTKTNVKNVNSELLFIAVEPGCRKEGVAKKLVDSALRSIYDKGMSKVKVTILKTNKIVNNFLKNYGVHLEREFKFYGKDMILYTFK